jgi:hypothetical protein
MSTRSRVPLAVATLTCLVVVWLSLTVFADARWWNLVLAGLLLGAGGLLLRRHHRFK